MPIFPTTSQDASFKDQHTFEKRLAESTKIREKYPDRIACIVERVPGSQVEALTKIKYLVPDDLNFGQFFYIIRKRLHMTQEKAMFMFINNMLPPAGEVMKNLYAQYKDEDNFLYFTYTDEKVFGGI